MWRMRCDGPSGGDERADIHSLLVPRKLEVGRICSDGERRAGAVGHVVGISNYEPGDTFTYYFGSAWSKYDMPDMAVWQENVERYGRQLKTPLAVTLK